MENSKYRNIKKLVEKSKKKKIKKRKCCKILKLKIDGKELYLDDLKLGGVKYYKLENSALDGAELTLKLDVTID